MINSVLSGFDTLFFLYHTYSFVEYIVSGALICIPIKAALVEKLLFFSFCWEHVFSPIFTVCTNLSTNPFDWGWYGGILYGLHPIFSNHKLRSSSQNSGALSDTMVFGIPKRWVCWCVWIRSTRVAWLSRPLQSFYRHRPYTTAPASRPTDSPITAKTGTGPCSSSSMKLSELL